MGLPRSVNIREVGPRDGFQNEPDVVPTAAKVELIDALSRTGIARLEVTSFVREDVIPQLADATEVLARIDVPSDVSVSVLIPNERGLDAALRVRERVLDGVADRRAGDAARSGRVKGEATSRDAGDTRPLRESAPDARASGTRPARAAFDEINVFLSASETHNQKNVNRSIAHSLAGVERVLARARDSGLRCEAVISTAFGCPYEGEVPPQRVLQIGRSLVDAGAQEVGFGDTTGMANPVQVSEFFAAAFEQLRETELTAHFHNTRGQGLANVLAAMQAGVNSFESSFGEIGGCPVPAGATGNIATEDLVSMLHEMGVKTGIDLDALIACSRRLQELLRRPLTSHTLVAGPVDWRRPAVP